MWLKYPAEMFLVSWCLFVLSLIWDYCAWLSWHTAASCTTSVAPAWLLTQARPWPCTPATDSPDFSFEHSAWRKMRPLLCRRPEIAPLNTPYIFSTAQVWLCCGSLIKGSCFTLFSICPDFPRSDRSQTDITIWAEIWPKDSQLLMMQWQKA